MIASSLFNWLHAATVVPRSGTTVYAPSAGTTEVNLSSRKTSKHDNSLLLKKEPSLEKETALFYYQSCA